MKKIFNWTLGACFRTLGRFLAIFIVGVLLIFIGSKLGFKLDSILPIKVNAATVNQWSDNLPVLNRVQMYECGTSQCYEKTTDFGGISTGGDGDRKYIYSANNLTVDSVGGTVIQTTTGVLLNKGYLYLTKFYICNKPNISSYEYKIGNANYATPSTFNADILALNDSALSTSPGITSIGYSSCRLYSGLYVPNTTGNNWISIQFTSNTTQTSKFAIVAVETENLGIYTNTIKQIIESSNGNVIDAVNGVKEESKKTNDTITNNDISGANDAASGFFDNFSDSDFGLSSIITAPLRAINAMLNDICVSPGATYKGKSFSLPCGSMLWSREGGQDFRNFLNVLYGGFLVYLVICSLFLDIENLKNPNNDKVEVEKL